MSDAAYAPSNPRTASSSRGAAGAIVTGSPTPSRYRRKGGTDTSRSSPLPFLGGQRKEEHVRRLLFGLALAAAFAVPAAATAQVKPPQTDVICGTACDGGGSGWTGCSTATATTRAGSPASRSAPLRDRRLLQGNGLITSSRSSLTTATRAVSPSATWPGLADLRRRRLRLGRYIEGHAYYGTDGQPVHRATTRRAWRRLDLYGVMPPRWVSCSSCCLGARSVALTLVVTHFRHAGMTP